MFFLQRISLSRKARNAQRTFAGFICRSARDAKPHKSQITIHSNTNITPDDFVYLQYNSLTVLVIVSFYILIVAAVFCRLKWFQDTLRLDKNDKIPRAF